MNTKDNPDSLHHGQVFRASFLGSFLILVGSVLTIVWCVVMLALSGNPMWQAVALIGIVAGLMSTLVMGYRLLWRPVMIRVDQKGLFLKALNTTIPWSALDGARLYTVLDHKGGKRHVIEFVPHQPLHPEMSRGKLKLGSRANMLAGLPDYCYAMDGIDGDNAMLLAAISLHIPVLPPVEVDKTT